VGVRLADVVEAIDLRAATQPVPRLEASGHSSVAKGLAFPQATQAIKITRRRKINAKWSTETRYAVTSLA